jgi:hypothetical protein
VPGDLLFGVAGERVQTYYRHAEVGFLGGPKMACYFDIRVTNGAERYEISVSYAKRMYAKLLSSAKPSSHKGIQRFLPIRLTQTPTKCRVHPVAGIKLGKSWRFYTTRDSEQGTERVERVEAPVEAERKLVEVGL